MHDEVEITLIATGFPSPADEKRKEEEKKKEMENARSIGSMGQKPKFDARSMFSNYVQKEREEEMARPNVSVEHHDDISSSRVDVKSTNVPPWIEKLRKNKK